MASGANPCSWRISSGVWVEGRRVTLPNVREGGRETHGEAVAVGAGVEHMSARTQHRPHTLEVVEELAHRERRTGPVGEDRLGRRVS